MNKIFAILLSLGLIGCTQVDISSGGTKVCTGNDTLDCSDSQSDNSNDGDDNNTDSSSGK